MVAWHSAWITSCILFINSSLMPNITTKQFVESVSWGRMWWAKGWRHQKKTTNIEKKKALSGYLALEMLFFWDWCSDSMSMGAEWEPKIDEGSCGWKPFLPLDSFVLHFSTAFLPFFPFHLQFSLILSFLWTLFQLSTPPQGWKRTSLLKLPATCVSFCLSPQRPLPTFCPSPSIGIPQSHEAGTVTGSATFWSGGLFRIPLFLASGMLRNSRNSLTWPCSVYPP